MGKPGPSGGQKQGGKRPAENNVDARHTKRVLAHNQFSLLQEDDGERRESVEKKEKLPPFYVKGQPRELLDKLNVLVRKGLRAVFRLCADGVKITVPSAEHYKSVAETLQLWKVEYFTHDVPSAKPFKVILRGLHELDVSVVEDELKQNNLQPVKVFPIKRHNEAIKYRDQLYLVHLVGGSTNMRQLQSIRTLLSVVVEWERYKPVHREVTQCASCLNFGHGARNCHMKSRCSKCGQQHVTAQCIVDMKDKQPTCVNCGNAHTSTSRSCPKRAEFIERRKKASQPRQQKKKQQPGIDLENDFPPLPSAGGRAPNLPPLPLPGRQNRNSTQAGPSSTPPGFWGSQPGAVPLVPPTDGLTQVITHLTTLVSEMQKMMVQMMHFMTSFHVHHQRP